MKLQVNGETHEAAAGSSLQDLLTALGFTGKRLAVEVNLEIIPRSAYPQFKLNENDRIEIVHAIGGG